MDQATHSKIVSFLWGIADLFKDGKYPDVILPMCVLRRLGAGLEGSKKAILEAKELLDAAGITEHGLLVELIQQAGGGDYFDELLDRIRDIRSSERMS